MTLYRRRRGAGTGRRRPAQSSGQARGHGPAMTLGVASAEESIVWAVSIRLRREINAPRRLRYRHSGESRNPWGLSRSVRFYGPRLSPG
jgi:hypothetical protein